MKERIVIFGASSGAVKVAQTLLGIGLEIEFFVDNDKAKHGTRLENKLIKDPISLMETSEEYKIVIASIYHEEIKSQLLAMHIKQENIVLKEVYIQSYINQHLQELIPSSKTRDKVRRLEKNILIDLAEGFLLGGIEKWSITLTEALIEKNRDVTLLTNDKVTEIVLPDSCKVKRFDLSFHRYMQAVKELAGEMITQLPCVVIINKIGQVYMAANLVKQVYHDEIKILSVLHSDFTRTYEQNKLISNVVDVFLCVSEDVKNKFIRQYDINSDKVFFKDSPIKFYSGKNREYSKNEEPMILGYAGRLEKAQKRADLLIPLILKLEELNLAYRLNIAGEGSYSFRLREFIIEQGLENKVKLFGVIPFDQMNDFWLLCDIVINLSDIEGIGLSMLEAMSVGVVPVVTDTAGAKSFIENGFNGYVNQCGDINKVAESIKLLSENRAMLSKFGTISKTRIEMKCDMEDYIKFLYNLMV